MNRQTTNERSDFIHSGVGKIEWGRYQISGPRHDYRETILIKTFRKYVHGGFILDAGCGTGSLVFRLLREGFRVAAVESAADSVMFLRERLVNDCLQEKVSACVGSVAALGLRNSIFDGILCGEVLEHIRNDKAVVNEFYRVLKPGGYCICSVPANPYLWDLSDEMAGHQRRYQGQELQVLFETEGFQVVELFHWGFPLVRLYHKTIYLNRLKKMKAIPSEEKNRYKAISSPNPILSRMVSLLFRFDNLFRALPYGIGLILVARKMTQDAYQ